MANVNEIERLEGDYEDVDGFSNSYGMIYADRLNDFCKANQPTIIGGTGPREFIEEETLVHDKQVGGNHYKSLVIEPNEYNYKNKLPYFEGQVVKYVTRHKLKNGVEDIDKAIHYLELIKEYEYNG